ncbi:MAG TPA: hypothetical protein VMM77_01775 [Gemmatimonadaceae bacterium]|nr:hypothetical protein [Gemmatimonadaceae bacterium]
MRFRTGIVVHRLATAAYAFLFAAGAAAQTAQIADTAWDELYRSDLDSLRAFIVANHPGAVDAQNPDFVRTLADSYDEALRATSEVTNYTSYAIALARFGNRFQDRQLQVEVTRPLDDIRHAGLFPVYRDGGFVIAGADTRYGPLSTALLGAEVLGCDSLDVRQLFTRRVLSWRGRPAIESDWYVSAPLLFADYGRPTPPAPASCRFAISDRRIEIPLIWKAVAPDVVNHEQLALASVVARSPGVERLDSANGIWVNIPTFAADTHQTDAPMHALLDSLRAALEANPKWRLVVLDLRGNEGGESKWGEEIAQMLLGKRWAQQALSWLNDGVYSEWRVSPFNVRAAWGMVTEIERRHSAESADAKRMRSIVDSMFAALERGDSLYGPKQRRRGVKPPPSTKLPGRLVLLTSASCDGACLDFLDQVRLHPAAIHVGQATSADTEYAANWEMQLPSGLASISFPLNVYRNRRRASNVSLIPKVAYRGNIADSEAVRGWLLRNYSSW